MADEIANSPGPFYTGAGSVPVPDPTARTTEALFREIAALKEIVFSRIDGIEQAIKLFNDNLVRVPTALDKESERLKDTFNTRMEGLTREAELTREILD